MTKVSLVRHGLVENPGQVYYGRLQGFGLAEEGRAQAAAAGRHLTRESITAIYHSPMLRAYQTATILRAQLSAAVPLVESNLLNEIYSPFDGRPTAEMESLNWDFYQNVSPPYEQPEAILARILTFFQRACHEHPTGHVVGVTHGDPIAFAILWAFSLPITAERRHRLTSCGVPGSYPAPASISTFTFAGNETGDPIDFCYACPGGGI